MNNSKDHRNEVLKSAFSLARALKRRPPRGEHHFPPSLERALGVIYNGGDLSVRDLGEELDIRPSSVSELVDRLEKSGLAERKSDDSDRRLTRIALTDLGKAEAEYIRGRHDQAIADFSSCFTDEEAAKFCELADKLSAHLQEREDSEEGAVRPHGRGPRPCRGRAGFHGGPGPRGPKRHPMPGRRL